jgi:DNA-directed RNA polymerase subunit RPC12/RpoP
MEKKTTQRGGRMTDSVTYKCSVCGREVQVAKGAEVPICCGKEMEPLPFCTTQPHPEMARNYDEDLPCDDATQHHAPPGPDTGVNPGKGEPGGKD